MVVVDKERNWGAKQMINTAPWLIPRPWLTGLLGNSHWFRWTEMSFCRFCLILFLSNKGCLQSSFLTWHLSWACWPALSCTPRPLTRSDWGLLQKAQLFPNWVCLKTSWLPSFLPFIRYSEWGCHLKSLIPFSSHLGPTSFCLLFYHIGW